MIVDYHQISPEAKVWVYQSSRELTPEETQSIQKQLRAFLNQWTSHGANVKAYGDVYYNRFIVLMADEDGYQIGGCSIDSSVQFIQALEKQLDVAFFDRLSVNYRTPETIETVKHDRFAELIETGAVTDETIVFNNLVQSKADFNAKWEVPLKDSWHKQVF